MNDAKRKILRAAASIIDQVAEDEAQDLRDQPDQIEHSAACQVFRDNVTNLRASAIMVRRVVTRGTNREDG